MRRIAVGLLLGAALDAVVPDPRRGHPVAAFGTAATALEGRLYADDRWRGVLYAGTCVGAAAALGRAVSGGGPAVVAAATWTVLGARSLRTEGEAIADLLAADDLPAARQRLTHLVGRDP